MERLELNYRNIEDLRPRKNNPRTHSPRQIEQIARSIERFGFTNPVLIDEADGIVAGHGRVVGAKRLGMTQVPTVCLADMSEADVRAYVIADNRLAEVAGWDQQLLGLELQGLLEIEADFDLTLTGFELPEIDILLGSLSPMGGDGDEADEIAEPLPGPSVTREGDVWQIGPHRLICGDATDRSTFQRLLGSDRAQMVFSDPPYNVPISGHVCGLGAVQHREFAMASGEMSRPEFTDFLSDVFTLLADHSVDGAMHFLCMDWRHMGEMLTAGEQVYDELKNLCVWVKTNGGMGSLYRSQHELVYVFKSGRAPHINNVELGKHGRYRTNVWTYAGVNSFGQARDDLALHPTVKPVNLIMDAIRDCSHRKGIVLDAFAGSGSTLVAAHKTGRRGYAIEIDPAYCDVIVRRMQRLFGLEATRASDETRFADAEAYQASAELEEAHHVA